MTASIAIVDCADCERTPKECKAERKRMLAGLRTGKPGGYTWRMYYDPKAGWPKSVNTGPLRTPAWAYPTPAYKQDVNYPDHVERARVKRIEEYFATRATAPSPARTKGRTTMTGYDGNGYNVGDRIELHPGCDLWMRGARYGTVVGSSVTRDDRVRVKLDKMARIFCGPEDRFRRIPE